MCDLLFISGYYRENNCFIFFFLFIFENGYFDSLEGTLHLSSGVKRRDNYDFILLDSRGYIIHNGTAERAKRWLSTDDLKCWTQTFVKHVSDVC